MIGCLENLYGCLIFPFIARREVVAVPVAGWQVYRESTNMYIWKEASKPRRSLDTNSKQGVDANASSNPSMPGWTPNDASKRPAQSLD